MGKSERQIVGERLSISLHCDADISVRFRCTQSQLHRQIDTHLEQIIHEFNRLILADEQAKQIYFVEKPDEISSVYSSINKSAGERE